MLRRVLVIALLCLSAGLPVTAAPAQAQTVSPINPFASSDPFAPAVDRGVLQIEFNAHYARGDYITLGTPEAAGFADPLDLMRSIASSLGYERDQYDVELPDETYDPSDPYAVVDPTIRLHNGLFKRNGSRFELEISSAPLTRTAERYGFSAVAMRLCTQMDANTAGSTTGQPTDALCATAARNATAAQPSVLTATYTPDRGAFVQTLNIVAAVAVVLTLIVAGAVFGLRRQRVLGTGSLVTAILLTGTAVLAWLIGLFVLMFQTKALGDMVMSLNWAWGGYVLLTAVPALLLALPFAVGAVLCCFGRPKGAGPQTTSSEGMYAAPPSQPQAPASHPPAQQMPSWLQPQPQAQPQNQDWSQPQSPAQPESPTPPPSQQAPHPPRTPQTPPSEPPSAPPGWSAPS